ncbi:hypothetical protein LGX09_08670, partial [Streptococcus mutans]|nr:hypothetical protein [Streptococcus mutans]
GKNFVGEAKFLGKGIKFLGKVGTVATVAQLGFEGLSGGINEFSKSKNIGKAVTGGTLDAISKVGPLEGATVGATIGGAFGTAVPVPVIGTVSGVAIGATAGLIIGGANSIAQALNPHLYDDIKNFAAKEINKVGKGIESTKNAVSHAIGGVGKALGFG